MLLLLFVSAGLFPAAISQKLSQGISELGFALSNKIEGGKNENFVLSPFSAHNALSQILAGSQANTETQLQNILGITSADLSSYGNLQASLKTGNSTLKVANLLALAKGFKPKSAFTQTLQTRFNSQLKELDFAGNAAASVKEVNDFVSGATNGKISSILSEDQVDSLTRVILLNAVYFKALWKTAFDSKASRTESFFKTPNNPVETSFMHAKLKLRMKKIGNSQVLELPYTDASKGLLIVLPEAGFDSSNILGNLNNQDLSLIREEREMDTQVTLPRFTIEKEIDLKELLNSLGVTDMFGSNANLRGISEQPLQVDAMRQKAFIEVTEEGTEAAAVTIAAIGLRTASRTRSFVANRPFGFVVYDFQEKVPLFMGKVVNPVSSAPTTSDSTQTRTAESADYDLESAPAPAPAAQADCSRYVTDYANAAENSKLCTEAETKKLFDWLRSFRSTCERSRGLINNFENNNCGSAWCQTFQSRIAELRNTQDSKCTGAQKPKPADQTLCRQTINHIKAYNTLNCL